MSKRTIYAADLFCGAGGTSQGMLLGANQINADLKLIAINHWQVAIDTHTLNHPEADNLCTGVDDRMSKSAGWDLTSTHSLEAWTEYWRRKVDAVVLVVIRPGDGALAADPLIDVLDVHDRLWDGDLPKLMSRLRDIRNEERLKQLRREARSK